MTKKKLGALVSIIALSAATFLTAATWKASTKTLKLATGDVVTVKCSNGLTVTSVDLNTIKAQCAATTTTSTTAPSTTTTAPATTTTTAPATTTTSTTTPPSGTFIDPSQTGPRSGYAPSDKVVNGVRVISDTVFTGTGQWALYTNGTPTLIQYSSFNGKWNTAAAWGDNLTVDHSNVNGYIDDAFKLGSNSHITNNWVHDCTPESGAHADAVQVQDGITNSSITGNYFDPGASLCNSSLFISPDLGPTTNGPLTIMNNYVNGGNYTVYIVDGNNGQYFIHNITFSGNRFGRDFRYGSVDVNVPVTWSDNSYLDNGETILP